MSASAGQLVSYLGAYDYCNRAIHRWKLQGDSIRQMRGIGQLKEDAGWNQQATLILHYFLGLF